MKYHPLLLALFIASASAQIFGSSPPQKPDPTNTNTNTNTDTNTAATTAPTSSTPTSTSQQPTSTSTSTSTTPTSTSPTSTPPQLTSTPPPSTSASLTTNAQGQTSTLFVTLPPSQTDSSTAPSDSNTPTHHDDGGISMGTIIGLSVAGGIAGMVVIGFIIWKLTRKRFSDFEDPDEAIRWPEPNRENFDSTPSGGLSREMSRTTYPSSGMSHDNPSEVMDPYAVPPLPHLNPSQPYRDDPNAAEGYYDPYRGPVPQSMFEGSDGHENIPMNAYPRAKSPGPAMGIGMGGRGSPAMGYNPQRTYSPAPAAQGYGVQRGPSPGPAQAYGAPRGPSPGPGQAYQ